RIGRTGRAGRDGLAITFAEFRDRRKIGDIEHYSRQRFEAETIPGLEPKARFEQRPPRAGFGGKPGRPGERRHGGGFGGNGGGFGGNGGNGGGFGKHTGFGARAPAGGDRRGGSERREGGFAERRE